MVEENVPEEIEDETGEDNMGEKDVEKENKKKDSEVAKKSRNKRKQMTDVEIVEPTEQMMEADVEIRHEPKKSRKLKEVDGRMTWNDQKAAYLVDCYATIIRRTAAENGIPKGGWITISEMFQKKFDVSVPPSCFENYWHQLRKVYRHFTILLDTSGMGGTAEKGIIAPPRIWNSYLDKLTNIDRNLLLRKIRKDSVDNWTLQFPIYSEMNEILSGKITSDVNVISISDLRKEICKNEFNATEDSDISFTFQSSSEFADSTESPIRPISGKKYECNKRPRKNSVINQELQSSRDLSERLMAYIDNRSTTNKLLIAQAVALVNTYKAELGDDYVPIIFKLRDETLCQCFLSMDNSHHIQFLKSLLEM